MRVKIRYRIPLVLALAVAALLAPGCMDNRLNRPVARAGEDMSVEAGEAVTLDGSRSLGRRGRIVTWHWTQLEGTPVQLSDPSGPVTTFITPETASGVQVLVFCLAVTDEGGGSNTDTVRVTVRALAGQAKYVILLIGDGMQMAYEVALSRYLYGTDQDLSWHSFPLRTVCATWHIDTYDRYAWAYGAPRYTDSGFNPVLGYDPHLGGGWTYDGWWNPPSDEYFLTPLPAWGGGWEAIPATDSAASGTALACGRKTEAGNVNWAAGDPANGALTFIGEECRGQKSMALGVVTTVPFAHATPACFASHATTRYAYEEISTEIIHRTRPDVVIGAGHPDWSGFAYISEDDYAGLKSGNVPPYSEYLLVEREVGMDGGVALEAAVNTLLNPAHPAHGRKLFGLFGGWGGYMEHPEPEDAPGMPGFTWPEGAEENPSLGECTRAALRVLTQRGKGRGFFLMVEGGDIDWANHAMDYSWMIGAMHQFDEAMKAVHAFVEDPATPLTWENTLVILTSDHSNGYLRFCPGTVLGRGRLPAVIPEPSPENHSCEIWYGAPGVHTNEPVMVYARGAGASLFRDYQGRMYPSTRLVDNTDIHAVMRRAVGLR